MHELDDSVLLREYVEHGSDAAFATLVTRHINKVYSVALRHTRNPGSAEEITQAVFVILARKSRHLGKRVILSGWLYQTARLTAVTHIRAEIRRVRREQEAHMQTSLNETDPDVWPQIAPLLDAAMAGLSETERQAIVLRFFDGKSMKEAGAALGASEDAVKMRVNRAVEKLRRFFSRRGIVIPAAALTAVISAHSVQAAPVTLAKAVTATAVAKGAAATTSTSTLVKGALKIMAWTKVKMAAVTGGVIILATIATMTVINHHRHSPPAQTGRMKLPTGDVTPTIAYGGSHYVVILASDGSLWSWGEESLGWPVLGYTNVKKTVSLRRIGVDNDWRNIAVSDSQCLAVKSDGSLWAWGGNWNYQLGDGTKNIRPTPAPSVPGNDWKQAAAGGSTSYGLKNDGTLWAWGTPWAGQLGTGGTKAATNAVQVGTSTNWTKVWGGNGQIVGLQSDGSLWFWGSLDGSGAKDKTFTVPTRISPDTNWTDVCFGYFTMFALKSDGTLWTWGLKAGIYNGGPDNGLDGSSVQLTPMQIGEEADWLSFSSSPGCFYLLLRKTDGSLWALDASEHRLLKPASQFQPIPLRKIDFPKAIAAYAAGADDIGVVLTPDGEVWTWGSILGELSPKDYHTVNGRPLRPKHRIINQPWQVSNIP